MIINFNKARVQEEKGKEVKGEKIDNLKRGVKERKRKEKEA